MTVKVITDSTNYLPGEELERLDITRVPLYVHDGDELRPETEIDVPAFYRRLADTKTIPTSSQPSPEQFVAIFTAAVEAGRDVVAALMSAKMSGTVQSAELAAAMVREKHPNARIEVLDTESNCMQEGYAVLAAAEAAASGSGVDDCLAAARETMRRTRFIFSPRTLEYLVRGGRISGGSAFLGSLLQIVPILTVEDGVTTAVTKVRTQAKALVDMAERFRQDTERYGLRRVLVHGIVDMDEMGRFAREYIEPIVGHPVETSPIGPVIGLHVGPACGVCYETMEPLR